MARNGSVATFRQRLKQAIGEAKHNALTKGAEILYTEAARTLDEGSPGKGKRYKRGNRYHRASRRGAAPARDTGRLAQSIGVKIESREGRAAVGFKAPYAKFLDPPKGKKEPAIGRRPFLSKAFNDNEERIKRAMADEVRERLRRV